MTLFLNNLGHPGADAGERLPVGKGHAVGVKRDVQCHPLRCRHPKPYQFGYLCTGNDDIQSFAVGQGGAIRKWDGTSWTGMTSPETVRLDGVYGTITGDEVAIQTDPFFQIAPPPGGHVKEDLPRLVSQLAAAHRERRRQAAAFAEPDQQSPAGPHAAGGGEEARLERRPVHARLAGQLVRRTGGVRPGGREQRKGCRQQADPFQAGGADEFEPGDRDERVRALRARLLAMPKVALREQCEVTGFELAGGRVAAVHTPAGSVSAGHVIVCGGAWASGLLEQVGIRLPVRPVKGQMILFKAPPGLVRRVVLMDGRYVIPRADGRVLAGSTLEETGFDRSISREARESLWQSAIRIIPALADCEVEHHWAGLRPGSPDGVPFIGAVPGVDNLSVNAGHYRNGLVLAPASTRLLVDQLLGREPILDPAPYRLGRE